MTATMVRRGGTALQIAGSQVAVASCYYLVLAVAARHLDAAGFAGVSAFYLVLNAVGRGLFGAVELECTRAVAHAVASGHGDGVARRAARRNTVGLLGVALVLLAAAVPLLTATGGSVGATAAVLGAGALGMATSYLLRGPLAGHRRYGRYGATYWAEALAAVAGAGLLTVLHVTVPAAWMGVFALAPLAAPTVVALGRVVGVGRAGPGSPGVGPGASPPPSGGAGPRGAVLWSAALLLAGQGVWNLAPVVLTARLADAPEIAAGFTTAAVILRAPSLLVPSVQALLLPRFTAMAAAGDEAGLRRSAALLGGALAVAGTLWIAAAVFVVPAVAGLVFATTTAPPAWVLAALALATVLGAAAQIGQTQLVALARPAPAASAWLAGLAVLLAVGLLVAPPLTAATLGLLAGTLVVLAVVSVLRRGRT